MSYAHEMKSMNCISATGRSPMCAAPAAAPTIAASEIGVSITRDSPKRLVKPSVTLNAPIQSYVFAEDEDAIVALHLFPEPLTQRFEERDFGGGHYRLLNQSLSAAGGSTYTPGSAVSGSGNGSFTQASVA